MGWVTAVLYLVELDFERDAWSGQSIEWVEMRLITGDRCGELA